MEWRDKRNQPESPSLGMPISQRQWRCVGGGAILGAAVMAWYGQYLVQDRPSLAVLVVYWGLFLLLLLLSLYIVLLDIRYIRLQYALERREAFLRTLGSEELRKIMQARQARDRAAGEADQPLDAPVEDPKDKD